MGTIPQPTPNLQPAIDRLKVIAGQSGDHLLLGDGTPHPDAGLLDLCVEIARLRGVAEAAWRRFADTPVGWSKEQRVERDTLRAQERVASRALSCLLRRAGSLAATTPAGIYAKAIAVRTSKTGAALLGVSLAEDLIDNPALRASLWSAAQEVAPELPANVVSLIPRREAIPEGGS